MKIAILLTSNDTSEFTLRFPNDGDKFISLLAPLRPAWDFHVIPVMDNVFPGLIDHYDGYLITGSPASVNDPDPWIETLLNFIRKLDEYKVPTVGCCFGHQAIAKALGGKVDKNPTGWELGRSKTDFNPIDGWNPVNTDSIGLYSAHCEQVLKLPPVADILGTCKTCTYASFKIRNHFFTTQYHPELSYDFMDQLLDYMLENNEIEENIWKHGKVAIQCSNESEKFARIMVTFLERSRELSQEK